MSPGTGPEGFTISPNGKWAATPLIEGSGSKPSDWFRTEGGELAVMSIGHGGKLTVTGKAKLGALPEGIAFSPDSAYIYVGNYKDQTLQTFRVNNGKPVQVGPAMELPGQPASMRGVAR
jgi:6-phosphogluconolactonase (cycloisomerase 2 family)